MDIALLNMLQVSDSVFPIGSFTLSNGLESFVQENKLVSSMNLKEYVKNYISFMSYNELGFFSYVYSNVLSDEEIIAIDTLYSAYKIPFEVRKGSIKLCQRFLKVWEKIEDNSLLNNYKMLIKSKYCEGHHSIALALFVKSKALSYEESASIYAYSVVSGIITNAVKSVPLSQLDGQVILNQSLTDIKQAVEKAKNIQLDELGICGSGFDIYAMKHETLYSRIYMS